MGVSKHDYYQLTPHAKKRYKERIDFTVSNTQMLKDVRKHLCTATCLTKKSNNREVWLSEENKIVYILETSVFKVITVYRSVAEYQEDQAEDQVAETLHPKAVAIVSDLVKTKYRSVKTTYYAELAELYTTFGNRLDTLSRTSRNDMFHEGEEAIQLLKQSIVELEKESKDVLESLDTYIERNE